MTIDSLISNLDYVVNKQGFLKTDSKQSISQDKKRPKDTKLSDIFLATSSFLNQVIVDGINKEKVEEVKQKINNLKTKYDQKCKTIFAQFLTSRFVAFFIPYYKNRVETTKKEYDNFIKEAVPGINNRIDLNEKLNEITQINESISQEKVEDPKEIQQVRFFKENGKCFIRERAKQILLGSEKEKRDPYVDAVQLEICDFPHLVSNYDDKFAFQSIMIEQDDIYMKENEWSALASLSKKSNIKQIIFRCKKLELESIVDSFTIKTALSKVVRFEIKEIIISDPKLADDDLIEFVKAFPDTETWQLEACTELTKDSDYLLKILSKHPKSVFPKELKSGVIV